MSEEGPLDIPMAFWPEVRLIEGAHHTLAALTGRYPIAIATNATVSGREDIERALDRVDLLQYIDEIFCFTEIGWRKDSRRFWEFVTAATGVRGGQIAMIGDSLEQDVIGPRESGIQSIWFNQDGRQFVRSRAYPTITRLLDAVPLVDGILAPD